MTMITVIWFEIEEGAINAVRTFSRLIGATNLFDLDFVASSLTQYPNRTKDTRTKAKATFLVVMLITNETLNSRSSATQNSVQ